MERNTRPSEMQTPGAFTPRLAERIINAGCRSAYAMKRLLRAFVYSMLLAFLSLFSVAALWRSPAALAAALAAISAIMLLVWRSREDLYLYIIVGISGALAELAAVGSGVW